VDPVAKRRHGGRVEQVAQGQFHVEDTPDARDGSGCEQRVPPSSKKLSWDADALQVEHLGPDGGELLLDVVTRGDEVWATRRESARQALRPPCH
jgi:hypothetical protein